MKSNWILHFSHTFFMLCGYNSTIDLETRRNAAKGLDLRVDSVTDAGLGDSA